MPPQDQACSGNRCVLLTPPGSGAIGVVRVIGPDAHSIVSRLVPAAGFNESDGDSSHNRLHYGNLTTNGEVIDDVVVTWSDAHSEPTADICAHGGIRVIERILVALEEQGAELTDDLTESIWPTSNLIEQEADDALTRALTVRGVRFLAWQRSNLANALSKISEQAREHPKQARDSLAEICGRFEQSDLLLRGATVVIVGPPNAGKSTLFNRITDRPSALVSDIAGTTRDWVSASIEMGGIPITLVDTAGWNESAEWLEQFGIDAGQDAARRCDVCVLVLDGGDRLAESAAARYRELASKGCCLVLANKSDVSCGMEVDRLAQELGIAAEAIGHVSAMTGSGIEEATGRILRVLGGADNADRSPALFTPRQVSVAQGPLSNPKHAFTGLQQRISSLIDG